VYIDGIAVADLTYDAEYNYAGYLDGGNVQTNPPGFNISC